MAPETNPVAIAVEILIYAAAMDLYARDNRSHGRETRGFEVRGMLQPSKVSSAMLKVCAWDARPYPLAK